MVIMLAGISLAGCLPSMGDHSSDPCIPIRSCIPELNIEAYIPADPCSPLSFELCWGEHCRTSSTLIAVGQRVDRSTRTQFWIRPCTRVPGVCVRLIHRDEDLQTGDVVTLTARDAETGETLLEASDVAQLEQSSSELTKDCENIDQCRSGEMVLSVSPEPTGPPPVIPETCEGDAGPGPLPDAGRLEDAGHAFDGGDG